MKLTSYILFYNFRGNFATALVIEGEDSFKNLKKSP